MTGGIIAVMEAGPRLKEIFKLLDICCDEIDDCKSCNMRRECDDYCDTHLYNKKEPTPHEHQKHMAVVMRRRRIRKRQSGPLCEIEFLKASHRDSNLVCGGI